MNVIVRFALQTSTNPKSDKAKLISRMAKMGQPMLPMTGATPSQPDDDDEEETPSTHSAQVNTVKHI